MLRKLGFAAAVGLAAWGGGAALAGNDIVAVSWGGNTYAIDSATGAGVLLGASGFSQLNASAVGPDGTFYASSGLTTTSIISIDTNTGVGTLVTTTDVTSSRGMAFGTDGTLFVAEDNGFGSPDMLHTLDLGTGNKTPVGSMVFTGVQGLAVDPTSGRMYAWDVTAGLLSVNTITGEATDVNPNVGGDGNVQGLSFDAAGTLFGGRDSLFTIDLATGVTTLVGSGGYSDARGMDFLGGSGRLSIRLSGQCPGQVTLTWSNATPGRPMGILFAASTGNFTIPGGVCAGTQTGLSSAGLQLVFTGNTGSNGSGQLSATAGTSACRRFVQMVVADGSPCATSNVAQIP